MTMDILTAAERSQRMSLIRSKNTKPERVVRSLMHRLGYRFRIHRNDLPGCPDLVLVARKQVVFVHGCFWHAHQHCKIANRPKSSRSYWNAKFKRNVERDRLNYQLLRRSGWKVVTIWECETRDEASLGRKILIRLGPSGNKADIRGQSGG